MGIQPVKLCYHQFEDHLAIADDRDTRQVRLNRFSNANPLGSRINEIRYINEDDQVLLLAGSSDGVIKIYRSYEVTWKIEVVTAFRALTDLIPSNKNASLVLD